MRGFNKLFAYFKRYFLSPYCTNKKRLNFMLALLHWKVLKSTKLKSYPIRITVCPGNICNLKCVHCPTGKKDPNRKPGLMSFDLFKKIMDECGPYLYTLDLANWGEPLLSKDFFKMARYAKKYKIEVETSTNLNYFKKGMAEELVKSGLDTLIISLDGASQKSVEKYQKGSNFKNVINNIKQIVAAKKQLKSKTPLLQWRFLVNKYNEHEIGKAKKMSKELGIDRLEFAKFRCDMGDELLMDNEQQFEDVKEWLPTNESWSMYDYSGKEKKTIISLCYWLWLQSCINWNGSVAPCPSVWHETYDFGSISNAKFKQVWNSRKYINARRAFRDKSFTDSDNICFICKSNKAVV